MRRDAEVWRGEAQGKHTSCIGRFNIIKINYLRFVARHCKTNYHSRAVVEYRKELTVPDIYGGLFFFGYFLIHLQQLLMCKFIIEV